MPHCGQTRPTQLRSSVDAGGMLDDTELELRLRSGRRDQELREADGAT
jgi:hypothetical protein